MGIRHWPSALQAAGIPVRVHAEVHRLSNGPLRDHNIVWHHDASPPGDSPGALSWMKSNFANASAQIWVDRAGVWHFISFGVAYHAGSVNDSRFNNYNSVGIETDHTLAEAWVPKQLDSLRRGTAVVLKLEGKGSESLAFHKTICVPRGRKSDPDGLDLATERGIVAGIINNEEDELSAAAEAKLDEILKYLYEQNRVPGAGYSWSHANNNAIAEANKRLENIQSRLQVPEYPFDWLPHISNQVQAVHVEVEAVEAIKADGGVDVADLAERLAAILPEEIRRSLGEALLG